MSLPIRDSINVIGMEVHVVVTNDEVIARRRGREIVLDADVDNMPREILEFVAPRVEPEPYILEAIERQLDELICEYCD